MSVKVGVSSNPPTMGGYGYPSVVTPTAVPDNVPPWLRDPIGAIGPLQSPFGTGTDAIDANFPFGQIAVTGPTAQQTGIVNPTPPLDFGLSAGGISNGLAPTSIGGAIMPSTPKPLKTFNAADLNQRIIFIAAGAVAAWYFLIHKK